MAMSTGCSRSRRLSLDAVTDLPLAWEVSSRVLSSDLRAQLCGPTWASPNSRPHSARCGWPCSRVGLPKLSPPRARPSLLSRGQRQRQIVRRRFNRPTPGCQTPAACRPASGSPDKRRDQNARVYETSLAFDRWSGSTPSSSGLDQQAPRVRFASHAQECAC
jgi:hypothetical protein